MMAEAAEEALGRWARDEMGLPPIPEAVLRRLCSGSCAPIWDFVVRHVRHPRNVKKIRGNLLWYRHLEKLKGAGPEPSKGAGLKAEVRRLRLEVGALGGALGEAQETALELEDKLEAGLARRGAWLRRGAELRLLGATAAGAGRTLEEGREKLRPPTSHRKREGPKLEAALRAGLDPEVLVAVRAVCKMRAEPLEELLEPHPSPKTRHQMEAANERWLREAQALLSRHSPGAVLWALQRLAEEAPPPSTKEEPLSKPQEDPEAPPTVQSLLQASWIAVGQVWGLLPPKLPPPVPPPDFWSRLGGDPQTQRVARLTLALAGLEGGRGALLRGVQELRGGAPPGVPPPGDPPSLPSLGKLRQELARKRLRTLRSRQRLRVLLGRSQCRLRPLQERVRGVAKVALGSAPLALAEEGERLRKLLGELGRLGALGQPPPGPSPDPLLPVARALGLPRCQDPRGGLLPRAMTLRAELREGAWSQKPRPRPLLPRPPPLGGVGGGGGEGGASELLPRLRLVASRVRERIQTWPHLQALVSQWWEQPAQWASAPSPGSLPFSHWLERWSRATQALAPPPRPRPLLVTTPTPEEEGEEGGGA